MEEHRQIVEILEEYHVKGSKLTSKKSVYNCLSLLFIFPRQIALAISLIHINGKFTDCKKTYTESYLNFFLNLL